MTAGERREDGPLTPGEEAGLRAVIDKSIADDYHYHPLTVKMLLATLDAERAATPAPREDGWEELRREIEALPEANDGTAGEWSLVERRAVLAIVDRLAAARGEPGLREALQAVWDLGDELDSNHARWSVLTVAERLGVTIDAHNRFSEPPRNRNVEQLAECQAEVDRLNAALATPTTPEPTGQPE